MLFVYFCLSRPYFGMVLLTKREELLHSLPSNSNFYCRMLIKKYNPVYSFAYYSAELDIPIEEVNV